MPTGNPVQPPDNDSGQGINSSSRPTPHTADGVKSHQSAAYRSSLYKQTVKQRDAEGKWMGVDSRVIYGDETTLAQTGTRMVYVERTNLTARLMNGRLVLKTRGLSKEWTMLEATCVWQDGIYNLTRPVKTLRLAVMLQTKRRWIHRSPAMAAGIADHIWSIRQVMRTVPVLANSL